MLFCVHWMCTMTILLSTQLSTPGKYVLTSYVMVVYTSIMLERQGIRKI